MEEKTHKENLYEKFKHILELLTNKDFGLFLDKDISENEMIIFNGYITEEGFEYEISEALLPELIEELDKYDFFETNEVKSIALKQLIADKISNSTLDPFKELVFNEKISSLSEEHADKVMSFVKVQENLRSTIAENIATGFSNKKKYLRLVWNGNQTQLAELFQVLINRGWINPPQNKKTFVNTLCEMFLADNDDTMNKNILDYYYRDKYKANGVFSDIAPAPKKKISRWFTAHI